MHVAPGRSERSPSSIELSTSGPSITSANLIAAAPAVVGSTGATHALPEYCQVMGTILPVDPAALPINIQVSISTC